MSQRVNSFPAPKKMRIKDIRIENNKPHSYDVIVITSEEGDEYRITDDEIVDLLIESGKLV